MSYLSSVSGKLDQAYFSIQASDPSTLDESWQQRF